MDWVLTDQFLERTKTKVLLIQVTHEDQINVLHINALSEIRKIRKNIQLQAYPNDGYKTQHVGE